MTIGRREVLRGLLNTGLAAAAATALGEGLEGCSPARRRGATRAASSEPIERSEVTQAPSPTETTQASTSSSPAPTPTAQPTGPAVEITRGLASGNAVALTFHGAGDPRLAENLLTVVESAGAQVTVLAVGTWLEAQPQMAARILRHGHELGNHTYRHLTMPQLTQAVDESEITRCAQVLRRLTGSQGRWFRPSGTARATPAILEAAGRAGYANSLSYDVDPADYADPGASAVASRVLAAVRPGSIVSLHLGHAGTVQAMPQILDGLRAKGLSAVTMTTLMTP